MDVEVLAQLRELCKQQQVLYPDITVDGVEYRFVAVTTTTYPFYPSHLDEYRKKGIRWRYEDLHPSEQSKHRATHKVLYVANDDLGHFCRLENERSIDQLMWELVEGHLLPTLADLKDD